jgi:hypothetical protein
MTTKTLTPRTVEFYTTSHRVARAYRIAAQHNRSLTRFAVMHELGHANVAGKIPKHAGKLEMVMLLESMTLSLRKCLSSSDESASLSGGMAPVAASSMLT